MLQRPAPRGERAKGAKDQPWWARMAELADAPDSKSGSRERVGVRPSLRAPRSITRGELTLCVEKGLKVEDLFRAS